MFTEDHLTLRETYVESGGHCALKGAGFIFVFPKTGVAELQFGTVRQVVRPGYALVVNLSKSPKVRALSKSGTRCESFSVVLEHLFPIFGAEEICLLDHVRESLAGLQVYPGSNPVARECQRLLMHVPAQGTLEHRSQLLQIASVVLTDIFKNARRERVGYIGKEEHWLQALRKVSTQEMLGLSLDELAAHFACSRRQLNRLFHEHFGVSFAALKMEMRMVKAVSLLRHPDAKVLNVAEECGFHHLGLFNTCFRKRFGATAGKWRQQAAQTKPPSELRLPQELEGVLRGRQTLRGQEHRKGAVLAREASASE